jgi:hypothetical protein
LPSSVTLCLPTGTLATVNVPSALIRAPTNWLPLRWKKIRI